MPVLELAWGANTYAVGMSSHSDTAFGLAWMEEPGLGSGYPDRLSQSPHSRVPTSDCHLCEVCRSRVSLKWAMPVEREQENDETGEGSSGRFEAYMFNVSL